MTFIKYGDRKSQNSYDIINSSACPSIIDIFSNLNLK